MIFLKISAAILFEPKQARLHEVRFERKKILYPVLYTVQWLRQLRIFPMFARRAWSINYEINKWYFIFNTVFLLILKCLASKHCCVTIVVESNNMWKVVESKNSEGKEIKIVFSVYF